MGTSAIAFTISENNRAATESIPQPISAWAIRGFGGRSSLYAWIYRIPGNECYGFLRKKPFKLVLSCDSLDDTRALMMEAIADGRLTPDQTALQRDFINKMPARVPEEPRWLLVPT